MSIRNCLPSPVAMVWAAVMGAAGPVSAQQTTAAPPTIHELAVQDQADRQGMMTFSPERWQEVAARDSARRVLARQLLAGGAVRTGQDFEDASLIFQHGATPQDFLEAHVLAMAALAKGDTDATWISAATLDRYLQSVKQPQVFGTQYSWARLQPRPEGATQEPYDRDLLSDALRRTFCVAPLDDQRQNVAAMERRRPWPSPDHCP